MEGDESIGNADMIFIQPPGNGQRSDCDGGNEADVHNGNNLPRAQLQAAVDINYTRRDNGEEYRPAYSESVIQSAMPRLSNDERNRGLGMLQMGHSQRQDGAFFNVDHRTISRLY